MLTVEEGSIGGFGSHVLHFLALDGLLDSGALKVRPLVIPDIYIEHGTQAEQLEEAGLTAKQIAATALRVSTPDLDSLSPALRELMTSASL